MMEVNERTLAVLKQEIEKMDIKPCDFMKGRPIFISYDVAEDIGMHDHQMDALRYSIGYQPPKKLRFWQRALNWLKERAA